MKQEKTSLDRVHMGKLTVAIAVLMMCTAPSAVKFSDAPSLILALYRMTIAFVIMLIFVLLFQRGTLRVLTLRSALVTLAAGGFLGVHFTAFFASIQLGGAVTAVTVIANSDAILLAAVSFFFYHEPIRGRSLWGLLLATTGIFIVIVGDWNGGDSFLGDLAALVAAAAFTAYFLIGKRQRKILPNSLFTLFAYGGSAAFLALCSLVTGTAIIGYTPVNFLSALCLAVFPTILGHGLIVWAVRYLPPIYISMNKLLIPIGGSILAYFLFGVLPTTSQVVGSAVVLIGIALYLNGTGEGGRPREVPAGTSQPCQK